MHSQEKASNDTQYPGAFDLDFLETSEEWQNASDRCKSFIRGCATLDETKRMSVAQALQHHWVAHPDFVDAMNAEYARATADWKPRSNTQDLIEYVKDQGHSNKAPESSYDARLHQEVRSQYFPSQLPDLPSNIASIDSSAPARDQSQARLSPIDDGSREMNSILSAKPLRTTPGGDHNAAASLHNKRPAVEDNLSYLSIHDYAPPDSLPAIETAEGCSEQQKQWGQRLAMSIYEGGEPGGPDRPVSCKKLRV